MLDKLLAEDAQNLQLIQKHNGKKFQLSSIEEIFSDVPFENPNDQYPDIPFENPDDEYPDIPFEEPEER